MGKQVQEAQEKAKADAEAATKAAHDKATAAMKEAQDKAKADAEAAGANCQAKAEEDMKQVAEKFQADMKTAMDNAAACWKTRRECKKAAYDKRKDERAANNEQFDTDKQHTSSECAQMGKDEKKACYDTRKT